MSQVKVTAVKEAPAANASYSANVGDIVCAYKKVGANGPKGFIRLESVESSFQNGWVQSSKRSTLLRGDLDTLKSLNLKEGSVLPGKIVVKESTTPEYEGQEPKINPSTGQIVTHNGLPVYRVTQYVDNPNTPDELLQSDSVEAASNAEVEAAQGVEAPE